MASRGVVPGERGRAALICFQDRQASEITWWPDLSAALEADTKLTCSDCQDCHAAIYRDGHGRLRTLQVRRPDVGGDLRREIRRAMRGDGLALARLRDSLTTTEGATDE